ncbi:hypothetical protein F5148DRAFT_1145653 [Russula earlei]|uniref:Uncharacterized protein n=1 Tax=Russula earlei TaxID=71964 RepID=A0ACC0UMY0_9AGAM|nr:hypothetical protein F5148DRAFT_1145653 [Russula earlei]
MSDDGQIDVCLPKISLCPRSRFTDHELLKKGLVVQLSNLSIAATRVSTLVTSHMHRLQTHLRQMTKMVGKKGSMDETNCTVLVQEVTWSQSWSMTKCISTHPHVIYYYILLTCFQAQAKKRFHGSISRRSDSPINQSQDIMVMATPWAIVPGPNQIKEDVTQTCSSQSIDSMMTYAGPASVQDLGKYERTHATEDPWRFYASDSPIFCNSDSEEEVYASVNDVKKALKPEDQGCD